MAGAGFKSVDGHALATASPMRFFALSIAAPCEQTPTAQGWLDEAKKIAAGANPKRR